MRLNEVPKGVCTYEAFLQIVSDYKITTPLHEIFKSVYYFNKAMHNLKESIPGLKAAFESTITSGKFGLRQFEKLDAQRRDHNNEHTSSGNV